MMMRIALLGITHETNTFSPIVTDLAKFEADGSLVGHQIIEKHGDARTMLAGFLSVGDLPDVTVVPLAWAWANPSGTVTADAFEALCAQQLGLLADGGPWDAVFMAQHGAGVAEGHPDLDAEFVRRVRAAVGDRVPIGVALDMHSNVSAGIAEPATVIVGFLTNPHVDAFETARRCAQLTIAVARGAHPPAIAVRRVDAAISILRQATHDEPMAGIVARARAIQDRPGVLSVSVFEGYPYADVEDMGMSCLVVGDAEVVDAYADELADHIWAQRDEFVGSAVPPAEAVEVRSDDGPVVLLDVGDNIGGGGDGRSTTILAELRRARVGRTVTILHDPAAAAAAAAAGSGNRVVTPAGRPQRPGDEVMTLDGTVLSITDGRYEDAASPHAGYRYFDSGLTCAIELDDEDVVVVTSKLVLPITLEQLRAVGVEPTGRRAIVAKGVQSPQPAYGPIAGALVLVDTPGVTTSDLSSLDYRHRRRPLHPFERRESA